MPDASLKRASVPAIGTLHGARSTAPPAAAMLEIVVLTSSVAMNGTTPGKPSGVFARSAIAGPAGAVAVVRSGATGSACHPNRRV